MGKYNKGDKVRIKSVEWYNQNKEEHGLVINNAETDDVFCSDMSEYLGKDLMIAQVYPNGEYRLTDNENHTIGSGSLYMWSWKDWMFE